MCIHVLNLFYFGAYVRLLALMELCGLVLVVTKGRLA